MENNPRAYLKVPAAISCALYSTQTPAWMQEVEQRMEQLPRRKDAEQQKSVCIAFFFAISASLRSLRGHQSVSANTQFDFETGSSRVSHVYCGGWSRSVYTIAVKPQHGPRRTTHRKREHRSGLFVVFLPSAWAPGLCGRAEAALSPRPDLRGQQYDQDCVTEQSI
jgi:hypothetical protein